MTEFQFAGLFTDLIHREIHNPAELVAILLHMFLAGCTQQLSVYTCCLLRFQLLACGKPYKVTVLKAESLDDFFLAILQELGDTAYELSVLVYTEPESLACGLYFYLCADSIDLLTGSGEAIHHDSLYRLTFESSKATALHYLGGIGQYQIDTQIRLVGTILVHSLQIRDPYKRSLGSIFINTVLFKYGRKYLLYDGEYIFLRSEGHLHIQLIKLSGRTVCSRILITEAGSDLEITVKTGSHQDLLELLGCLGQSVELAGMISGRNQIISRTFRGRTGQNRGGDLHEVQSIHSLTQLCHDLTSHHDVLLHVRISQIQITVFQTGIFVCILGLIDLKRKCIVDTLT